MMLKKILIVTKDIERPGKPYPDIEYVNKLITHSWGQEDKNT